MVDMSSPNPAQRTLWILELKFRQPIRIKKGFQLQNADWAVQELIHKNIVLEQAHILHLHGSGSEILDLIERGKTI